MLELAKGVIPHHSVVNKFGSNPGITNGNTWEVWDGGSAYTWPTTASITHLRAGLDSVITRGVEVEIQGLDINYELITQTATTDAVDSTTEVALATDLLRVFRVKVNDDTMMDQQIWVGPTGFASKQAIIQIGKNQTLMAMYTVPAGYTAYITHYYGDYVRDAVKDPDGVEVHMHHRDNANGYASRIKHQKGIPKQASGFQHHFQPYYKVTEKSDIYIMTKPTGADCHAHAGFDIILVKN